VNRNLKEGPGSFPGPSFSNNKDRIDMTDRLADRLPATNTIGYAWAFLSEYYHLSLQMNETPLSKLMQVLQFHYAGKFHIK
jgi:hypothetical protein